jgi:hypothetical protein
MSFYDDEKERMISTVVKHRTQREIILDELIARKKITRDELACKKLYLDITLEDEQLVANRLFGKPVERTQEVEKCLIME